MLRDPTGLYPTWNYYWVPGFGWMADPGVLIEGSGNPGIHDSDTFGDIPDISLGGSPWGATPYSSRLGSDSIGYGRDITSGYQGRLTIASLSGESPAYLLGQALRYIQAAMNNIIKSNGEATPDVLSYINNGITYIKQVLPAITGGSSAGFGIKYGLKERLFDMNSIAEQIGRMSQNPAVRGAMANIRSALSEIGSCLPPRNLPTFFFIVTPDSSSNFWYYLGRPPRTS